MARMMRIAYAGAAYHAMARGNQGGDIYADERDRKLWLEALGQACEETEELRGVHGRAGAGFEGSSGAGTNRRRRGKRFGGDGVRVGGNCRPLAG